MDDLGRARTATGRRRSAWQWTPASRLQRSIRKSVLSMCCLPAPRLQRSIRRHFPYHSIHAQPERAIGHLINTKVSWESWMRLSTASKTAMPSDQPSSQLSRFCDWPALHARIRQSIPFLRPGVWPAMLPCRPITGHDAWHSCRPVATAPASPPSVARVLRPWAGLWRPMSCADAI